MHKIALIHAMRESIDPVTTAFTQLWPEAALFNLLDDSLPADRAAQGMSPAIVDRMLGLGRYARSSGADAILFTCSAFGPAIDAVAADLAPLPVHKPNSAMIAAAVAAGGRIALLATFQPTLESMRPEFPEPASVEPVFCHGALDALRNGDGRGHDEIVAHHVAEVTRGGDYAVVSLAQFSLARAAGAVALATGLPVLTTPDCAVRALKQQLEGLQAQL